MAKTLPDVQSDSLSLPYDIPQGSPSRATRDLAFDAMQLHRAMNMDRDELEARLLAQDHQQMLSILTGVVLYRQLDRRDQSRVLQMVHELDDRLLMGRFVGVIGQLVAQPAWHVFSLSSAEIERIMAHNRRMVDAMDDFVDPRDIVALITTGTLTVRTCVTMLAFALVFAAGQQNAQLGDEMKRRR